MGGGGDRRSSGGYGSSQLSSDPYGSVAGNDQYYSSFADNCKNPYDMVLSCVTSKSKIRSSCLLKYSLFPSPPSPLPLLSCEAN